MHPMPQPHDAIAATLGRGDWFATLPADMQQRLLSLGEPLRVAEGDCLFTKGDAPDGLYCVLHGAIRVCTVTQTGREMILALLEPAQWFGEIAVFDKAPRTHDAWAVVDTWLLRVPQQKLEHALALYPQDWLYLGRLLTQKLRAVFSAMADIALTSPTTRLARRLVSMANGFGTLATGTKQVIAVSQEDLGAMLSLSRQTINQSLRELESAGAIQRKRGAITIVLPDKLQDIAGA